MQSPRFGVAFTSSTVSSRSSASRRSDPSGSDSGELHDAVMLLAQTEFARGAEHAVRLQAAQLCALDADAARQLRADHRDGHLEPGAHVLGAANDLQPIAAVGGHLAYGQFLCIRMAAAVDHLPDPHPGKRRSHRCQRLHLQAGQGELLGQLRRGHRERREFLEPREGDFHGNCFRNCKSFSKNSRRSSTP